MSNPDREYEKRMGGRNHRAFFGRVLTIDTYGTGTVVDVEFPSTACGETMEWSYDASELSLASELKNLTLEEFSNRYGVSVNGEYLR